ncbi:MAG: ATP-binding protein [Pseudomonadota bacterium]|nr:ATP-binding protein [Pseudomonadota bacterium]
MIAVEVGPKVPAGGGSGGWVSQRLRIFVSSPGDVEKERLRAGLIIDKLAQDYVRFFTIEGYQWEHEPLCSSEHFQDAIEPPSAFDIVLLILWSRLGTPLPEQTAVRDYRGLDGRSPVTGTEWEYEDALRAARANGAPDLLVFRNMGKAEIDPSDPDAQARSFDQLTALNNFWRLHFADRGVFLSAYDTYGTLEEFAGRLEKSLRKLIERRIGTLGAGDHAGSAPVWLGDPFRGLESYEFEHAPIFFGRDALITKATEQLADNAHAGSAFLLVSGASGSGKTSLVKAAVLPRLTKPQRIRGAAFLRRVVFRAGNGGADPFFGLAEALTTGGGVEGVGLAELLGPGQDAAKLAAFLRSSPDEPGFLFEAALGRLTETGRASGRLLHYESVKLIVVIDQLEELFSVSGIDAETRQQFATLLGGMVRSGHIWVIATLRADFWHRAADIPALAALAEGTGRLDLSPPLSAELAEIIRRPVLAAGLSFELDAETGLGLDVVLAAAAAAAEPGVLPLLSFTLDELYKDAKKRGSSMLTHASYADLGGLGGAIAARAEETIGALPQDARGALPQVLRALTTVSAINDHVPVSRSAPLRAFGQASPARQLVDALIAARLLVAGQGAAGATVRIAHEALIGQWGRATVQLAADRRDLETRNLVEEQFNRLRNAKGRARAQLLLRNPDLANAVDLARRWRDDLGPELCDYIGRSRRRARLARNLTALAAAIFALVALGAVVEGLKASRAQRQAQSDFSAAISLTDAQVLIADALNDRGETTDALLGYRAALATAVNLAKSDPANPIWRYAVALYDTRIGDSLEAQKNFASAASSYQAAWKIESALVKLDPVNSVWQRELAVGEIKLGDMRLVSDDDDGALTHYRAAFAVTSRLVRKTPSNAEWRHDLAAICVKTGAALSAGGDLPGAIAQYREALRILRGERQYPSWAHDQVVAHLQLGESLAESGQVDAAIREYRLALQGRIAPPGAQGDVSRDQDLLRTHLRLADTLWVHGDHAGALTNYAAADHVGRSLDTAAAASKLDQPPWIGSELKRIRARLASPLD